MDKIFLRELKVEAVIGIWEWERRIRQTVSIDIEMATEVRRAADADIIDGALNYRDVAKRLIAFVGNSEFQLVESLTESIAHIVVGEFGAPWVKVSVTKPGAIEGAKEVGATIERSADDYCA